MSLPELPEPEAYMFQHEETGNTMFVDRQQVEWGFEKNNPRLQRVSEAYTADQMRSYALQAVEALRREPMTEEQAKQLLKRSDLLDMFLHIGWYSAPRKGFDEHALSLIRTVEAHHHITQKEQG